MQDNNTKFKTVISFHGILLTVVENEGTDYIPLKPIVEMLGTQWKTARETAYSGDNQKLYGTCELIEPAFNVLNTLKGTKKAVFILLEAGEMYLARVNTSRLRANGNKPAAEYLLAIQKEWRQALHNYETHGFAVKSEKQKLEKYNLLSKLDKVNNPELKRLYAESLNNDYGLNIALGKQGALDV